MKGVWVAPTPQLIVGQVKEWAALVGVECSRIPAYWLEKESHDSVTVAPPVPGEKILYSLHGGAYALFSAHPHDAMAEVPRGIMQHTPSIHRSLALEYRITKGPSTTPVNPFPAALLDAIAGYNYLVCEVGFDPSDIILGGDSAGGNLALALVRYLIENQGCDALPAPPGALLLCSPWVDLGAGSDHKPDSSVAMYSTIDYLHDVIPSVPRAIDNFIGTLGPSARESNRYISPASQSPAMGDLSFKGFPKTFILSGGSEIIRDQVRVLYEKMRNDLGKDVEHLEQPDGVHDILAFPWFEPERSDALRSISEWVMK